MLQTQSSTTLTESCTDGQAQVTVSRTDEIKTEYPNMKSMQMKLGAKRNRFSFDSERRINLQNPVSYFPTVVSSAIENSESPAQQAVVIKSTINTNTAPTEILGSIATSLRMIKDRIGSSSARLLFPFVLGAVLFTLWQAPQLTGIVGSIENAVAAIPASMFLVVAAVYLVGGLVKGLAGLGMALIAVPVIGVLYNPVLAAAIVSLPLIASNLRQGVFNADVGQSFRGYYPLIFCMTITMGPAAYFANYFPLFFISLALGVMAICFALINLVFRLPAIPDSKDLPAQIVTGVAAGIAGGLSGLISIPLVIYMLSRQIEKERFVSVVGLLFLISGVLLLVGYQMNGILEPQLLLLSVFATLPAYCGTYIGERLRAKVNQRVFRQIVLYIILLIGVRILIPF